MSWSTLTAILAVVATGCEHANSAKSLFCAYGGIGTAPNPLPVGYETQFAVAVVEIDSPRETSKNAVTDFVLYDQGGAATRFKRIVEAEIFDRPRVASEGEFAYYVNPGGTRPFSGTLPVGRIRIRVRVALERAPVAPVRFRIVIGPHAVEGLVDGSWPT